MCHEYGFSSWSAAGAKYGPGQVGGRLGGHQCLFADASSLESPLESLLECYDEGITRYRCARPNLCMATSGGERVPWHAEAQTRWLEL